jgi:hypothetical protein
VKCCTQVCSAIVTGDAPVRLSGESSLWLVPHTLALCRGDETKVTHKSLLVEQRSLPAPLSLRKYNLCCIVTLPMAYAGKFTFSLLFFWGHMLGLLASSGQRAILAYV